MMPTSPSKIVNDFQRDLALRRYDLILPFLQNQKTLRTIAKEQHMALRTLTRWVKRFRELGLPGLDRKTRQGKGARRICSLQMQQLIEGLHLKQSHLSIASIHRQIKSYAIEHQLPCPSYRTVCAIIQRMPAGLVTLAHEGRKAYKNRYDLLYSHEAMAANDIWQADHVLLDILVQYPGKAEGKRPWLTVIIDDYSRCIAGYELSFLAPSATKTALCLHHAIWRKKEPHWSICGIPSTLYTDHGSDFTSQHIESVCIELKINLVFSQVGEPRGRGKIERFFRTLNQLLLSELEGYIGNKEAVAILTLSELDALIRDFIMAYNQRTHPTIQETPKQRWEKTGFLPRLPMSIEQLDLLLFTVAKPRQIGRKGIRFQGLYYIDPVLANYIGEWVTIRYDPADLTSVRVFYQNAYLCQPICQALDREAVSLKEIQTARNARRKQLQIEIKHRLSLVDAILQSKRKEAGTVKLTTAVAPKSILRLYHNE